MNHEQLVKHFNGNEVTIKCLFDGEELELL